MRLPLNRPRGDAPPLKAWAFLGMFDPPPRIHRDGCGISYGGICPRCHAYSWRKVRSTSWRQVFIRPAGFVHYHCTRCLVCWAQPHYPTASFWGHHGVDWLEWIHRSYPDNLRRFTLTLLPSYAKERHAARSH